MGLVKMGVLAKRMGVSVQLAPHENNYWNKAITLNIIKLSYFYSITVGGFGGGSVYL